MRRVSTRSGNTLQTFNKLVKTIQIIDLDTQPQEQYMMWVISLILLAVAAYFIISALNSKNKIETQNQASDGEVIDGESAQLSDTTSTDAFQNAGGTPAGSGSGNDSPSASNDGSLSGGAANEPTSSKASSTSTVAAAAAVGAVSTAAASTAAAIASASAHTLKGVTGNGIGDIQEMIKILNLRDSDSRRLTIEKDQFAGLASGTSKLAENELSAIADKLRWMLR